MVSCHMCVPESRINIPRSTLLIAPCLGPVSVSVGVGVEKIEERKNIRSAQRKKNINVDTEKGQ